MNMFRIAAVLLLSGLCMQSFAQENAKFAAFARTKDSLMHIAYYDKDIAGYKKQVKEFEVQYAKLNAADKKTFKEYFSEIYYYLACAYAANGDKVNALDYLERSAYYDYADLAGETAFAGLKKEPRFIKHLSIAKNRKSDYQLTLQKDARYNYAEQKELPSFSYQSTANEDLMALKEAYNLDSIAGQGNDVSRIINLMKWVHYLVPHDGSQGNPKTKNAMSFIKVCRRDGKTLNCRGLGILLNEVYLAAGFSSRFVTCLPKDTADNDCHVITMVWSVSLGKWLWMDPTFMAYVMNEDGEPLSIEEVRERLVTSKPLILNPDANRNHAASQTRADYLGSYMSKNLYKLECPLSSEYNYETAKEGKSRAYMQLLPGTTAPAPKVVKDKNGATAYTVYYTNNPSAFWAAPPAVAIVPSVAAHSQSDYEEVLAMFKKRYNSGDVKGMAGLTSDSTSSFWSKELTDRLTKTYGRFMSFKYLGLEADNHNEDVALFRVVFAQSTHCLAFALDEHNKIGTFRFSTTSAYIDWAMAKAVR